MIGKICLCSKGIPGLVQTSKWSEVHGVRLCKGLKQDGSPWQSQNPFVVAESWEDFWSRLESIKAKYPNLKV